jgi:hypothetical protein
LNLGKKLNFTAEHAENAEKILFLKTHLQERDKFAILAFLFGDLVKIRHSGESRSPGVVPTKVGNHLKDWVPVFTGNPGFLLPQG